jgi:hypothetical protein
MWFSEVFILIDVRNADGNGVDDILAAIRDTGASILSVDRERNMVEATVMTRVVPIISAIEGVTYVRSVFSYHCAEPAPADAAAEPLQAA